MSSFVTGASGRERLFGSRATSLQGVRVAHAAKPVTHTSRTRLHVSAATARVERNQKWGGSQLLSLRPVDGKEERPEYLPGHVFSLAVSKDGKTYRRPYTVARVFRKSGVFEVLYRVIPTGRATPVLETLEVGETVEFTGKFHQPIASEISPRCTKVVGISTGSGVGPLLGFAEGDLKRGSVLGSQRPVSLYCGYRAEQDISLAPHLDQLAARFPESFKWEACLSSPSTTWGGLRGRVTEALPALLAQDPQVKSTHFHLVGNGAMIQTMRAGLLLAGIDSTHVTSEAFFNGVSAPDLPVAQKIAATLNV